MGINATFVANQGDLNVTGSGFGINSPGIGDITNQFDDTNGTEFITVSFDMDVILTGLQLSSFTTSETASLSINGVTQTLTGLNAGNDVYSFTSGNFLSTGQTLVLAVDDGDSFSFDNITVHAAAVPEPMTAATFAIGLGLIVRRRRI